jgi:mycothiol synthase
MIELMMTLPTLPEGREPDPLPGFRLRDFAPGDEGLWLEIQQGTGIYGALRPDLFEREFGSDAGLHAERILFAEERGEAVGVTAAWVPGPGMPASCGRIHWVAVRPSHQRRGLGRWLVLATLQRLRLLGHESAYLTTGSENLLALSLYLSLGFEPSPRSEGEEAAWRAAPASLGRNQRV